MSISQIQGNKDTHEQNKFKESTTTSGQVGVVVLNPDGSNIAGGSGGGGASTIADGADIAEGATTDAAVSTDTTGTISGKIRGLVKIFASVLNQATNYLGVGITDGTNLANTLKSDGTAAGQNALLTSGTGYTTAIVSLSAGTPNSGWYDMLNFPSVAVEILTNTTPATITWQTSSDASQTNVRSMIMIDSSAQVNQPTSTTTSANGTYIGSRAGRYFRISTNLAGGNTATFVLTFFTTAQIPPNLIVSGTVSPSATTNTSTPPLGSALLGVFDDTSPTAITENSFGTVRMSTRRELYQQIRDAAGNERGLNVNSDNSISTQHTDGTNIVNVLKSDGTAAGQNAVITGAGYLSVAFTTTSAQAVGSTDVGNYKSVYVQITGQGGSSTVTFQTSNDNSNWVSQTLLVNNANLSTSATTSTTTGIWAGNLTGRYFRLNVTGIISGTTSGTLLFSTGPVAPLNVNAFASGIKSNNATTPSSTNLGVLPAIANAAQQSWTEGNQVLASVNLKGSVRNVIQDAALNDRGVNVTAGNALQGDITSVAGGAVTATNVAITDAPLNVGAQAVSSENSAVTTARKVQLVADLVGKLIVLPYANPENFVNGTTAAIVDTTSTSTIAAQGAGVRTYITQVTVSNSHATVGTFVKILDGSTIIHEAYAAAAGGGFTATFPVPLRGTANTAVNTQCVTTGANVIASVSGYKGA